MLNLKTSVKNLITSGPVKYSQFKLLKVIKRL